ncbi:hypothetical protein Bbelb_163470 [Branchiostoma belcheri]|nr:hypothetical protein Bbelb_163470 [Branchiostoma belcheri]
MGRRSVWTTEVSVDSDFEGLQAVIVDVTHNGVWELVPDLNSSVDEGPASETGFRYRYAERLFHSGMCHRSAKVSVKHRLANNLDTAERDLCEAEVEKSERKRESQQPSTVQRRRQLRKKWWKVSAKERVGLEDLWKDVRSRLKVLRRMERLNGLCPCHRGWQQSASSTGLHTAPPGSPVLWVNTGKAALANVSFHTLHPQESKGGSLQVSKEELEQLQEESCQLPSGSLKAGDIQLLNGQGRHSLSATKSRVVGRHSLSTTKSRVAVSTLWR